MPFDAESCVSDYAGSEHYAFLDPALKEHGEALLVHACRRAGERGFPEEAGPDLFAEVLSRDVAPLDLPEEVRRRAPELLAAFFDYLAASGRHPEAAAWVAAVQEGGERYEASLRADGTVRGETVRRTLSKVGRNDPCPCGSGRKYKKCCYGLFD